MREIIRNTIRLYLTVCGIVMNWLAINFLILKAPSAKELVLPTPLSPIQSG